MKTKSLKANLPFVLIIIGILITSISNAGEKVHPYNKILMKLYPRPFRMTFPHVPRILAKEALILLKTNKAIFVHVGDEGPDVPGCFHFREMEAARMNLALFRILSKSKFIILYCAWNNEGTSARVANTWIKKGVKNVRVVYGGSIEMKKAGFPFIKPARIRKNVRQNNFFFKPNWRFLKTQNYPLWFLGRYSNTFVRILEFIRSIFLARLLSPEIFGLWGIVNFIRQGIEILVPSQAVCKIACN